MFTNEQCWLNKAQQKSDSSVAWDTKPTADISLFSAEARLQVSH